MNEIICRIIELPPTINAVTVLDDNGDYNVYINQRIPEEKREKAFRHEKNHIIKEHFYTLRNVVMDEKEADIQ